MKTRRAWRRKSVNPAKAESPPMDFQGDTELVITCRDMLEPAAMTETLYEEITKCDSPTCLPISRSVRRVCKAADGRTCSGIKPRAGLRGMAIEDYKYEL